MSDKAKDIIEWIYCIIIAFVIAILIKCFIGTPTIVKQESMYPTLHPNDRVILSKIFKDKKEMPNRGDIITFEAPSKTKYEKNEVDLNNPVAIYDNEPTNIFSKFAKNVLDVGKTCYIKRVIGLPGDEIEIKNGKVYVNGSELEEDYLDGSVETKMEGLGYFNDFIVPQNCAFAMGDNRTKSMDCRSFGCIPLNKIEGRVVIRFWPLNKLGKVK